MFSFYTNANSSHVKGEISLLVNRTFKQKHGAEKCKTFPSEMLNTMVITAMKYLLLSNI